MIKATLKWLTGGALDRALSTVDKYVEAQTDRERIKAEVISDHIKTRPDWLRAGGLWLVMLFAVPLAFYYAAIIFYSVFFCAGCAYPQEWTIAALPRPLDEWSWAIIMAALGVSGIWGYRK